MSIARELAQKQLDAYNNKDIDLFASYYADDIQIFDFGNPVPTMSGKAALIERYGKLFKDFPELEAKLVNRIVQGNTSIDHEEVRRKKEDAPFYAIAIFQVDQDLIRSVTFLRG